MIGLIQNAIDRSAFLWWFNLNDTSSLKLIGGDSNLPEKKIIIKVLQHSDTLMHMLEIKSQCLTDQQMQALMQVAYKKILPFYYLNPAVMQQFVLNRQSFLSLLTLYNLCNIALNYDHLNKNKLKFHLREALDEQEEALFRTTHHTLKAMFDSIFCQNTQQMIQQHEQPQSKLLLCLDSVMLLLMLSCMMISAYSLFLNHMPNLSSIFALFSLMIATYFYLTRIQSYRTALEHSVVDALNKSRQDSKHG